MPIRTRTVARIGTTEQVENPNHEGAMIVDQQRDGDIVIAERKGGPRIKFPAAYLDDVIAALQALQPAPSASPKP